jgi:hypothetical protein
MVGDSRGHWEGSTLVVETTNFSDKRLFLGLSAEHQRVVERFTRTADTFDCQFTIDDPTRWTKSWKAEVAIEKTDGLRNILARGASAGKNRGRNKQIELIMSVPIVPSGVTSTGRSTPPMRRGIRLQADSQGGSR